MKVKKVLENLEELLSRWDITSDDWILVSQYAYRLLGYKVKLRKGHFNILVRRSKIPWKISEGVEIHPLRGSIYRKEFDDFINKTGFDFDINLATDEEFRAKAPHYVLYSLPNSKKIRVQKPTGAIKEYEKLLKHSTKEGFGVERLDKDIFYIKDMIKVLSEKKENSTRKLFQRLLKKYTLAKAKVKIPKNLSGEYLKGIVACKGRASGKAVIVNDIDDARILKDGDVLITKMTSPVLIAKLPKVSAIVTDQGGMLSHAAILAREIGIPCIVGTQFATKFVKNGDLVDVDAERGIVKKIR